MATIDPIRSSPPGALQRFEIGELPREEEVLRLLGHRPGTTRIARPMMGVLQAARDLAGALLHTEVLLREVADPGAFGRDAIFAKADALVLGVATAGAALEEHADRLVEAREWTLALVLDAYGSAAVEAAAVHANARVCEEAESRGLVSGRRLSPGYDAWPIEQQQALFARLGDRPLGIELNEASVMTPRKTVSFGIPLGRHLSAASPELGCRYCAMANCAYRRLPALAIEELTS